jgi:hypothetical protein
MNIQFAKAHKNGRNHRFGRPVLFAHSGATFLNFSKTEDIRWTQYPYEGPPR